MIKTHNKTRLKKHKDFALRRTPGPLLSTFGLFTFQVSRSNWWGVYILHHNKCSVKIPHHPPLSCFPSKGKSLYFWIILNQPVNYIFVNYSIFAHIKYVSWKNILREIIFYIQQNIKFTRFCFFTSDDIRHLIIFKISIFFCNKIYFFIIYLPMFTL